jgi:hypothetical protein
MDLDQYLGSGRSRLPDDGYVPTRLRRWEILRLGRQLSRTDLVDLVECNILVSNCSFGFLSRGRRQRDSAKLIFHRGRGGTRTPWT